MNLLFIGDIFGSKGREAIKKELAKVKKEYKIDFTIANAENCTHGRSISVEHYKLLKNLGIDFFTFGNHTWQNEEIYKVLENENTVRPLNVDNDAGKGTRVIEFNGIKIRITNLLGISVGFVKGANIQNPFPILNKVIESDKSDIHFIDFHCETTSEKNALFQQFKGKVSVIVGTHTHIQTNDDKIENDTAYLTDVGMTGGSGGIIGADKTEILQCFMGEKDKFKMFPSNTPYQFNAVVIEFNEKNIPISIKKIFIKE